MTDSPKAPKKRKRAKISQRHALKLRAAHRHLLEFVKTLTSPYVGEQISIASFSAVTRVPAAVNTARLSGAFVVAIAKGDDITFRTVQLPAEARS